MDIYIRLYIRREIHCSRITEHSQALRLESTWKCAHLCYKQVDRKEVR